MCGCSRIAVWAWVVIAAVLTSTSATAVEPSVRWHGVDAVNPTSPPPFAVSPQGPTSVDNVSFVAATDGVIYPNSCYADVLKGVPGITVDTTNKVVAVWFSDPVTNIACPNFVLPVMGVDGQLGHLAGGHWTFALLQKTGTNVFPFSVLETSPVPLSISTATNEQLRLSWSTPGVPLAVEFITDLSRTNWQTLTNTPVFSNGGYSIEIAPASGVRFFRLRRASP